MAARIPARAAQPTTTPRRTVHVSGKKDVSTGHQPTKRGREAAWLVGVVGVSGWRPRFRLTGRAITISREEPLAKMAFALPEARHVHRKLSQRELLERTHSMPNSRRTDYAPPNVRTRVPARSKASSFIGADDPEGEPHQSIDRDEWERVSAM